MSNIQKDQTTDKPAVTPAAAQPAAPGKIDDKSKLAADGKTACSDKGKDMSKDKGSCSSN